MGKGLEMTALSEASLHGRRVLVAEGEGPTRWAYVGLLRNAGARVTEARDGAEALELARAHPPDIIVADVAMPRLDGLGLCAELRREPALAGVSVVLLSDGAPPQAISGVRTKARPLVDAVLAALESRPPLREGPASGVRPTAHAEPAEEASDEPAEREPAEPASDRAERENVRAQSMVAMHREPANRISRGAQTVWRLRASAPAHDPESASRFGLEVHTASRLFGLGFVMLVVGTVGLLVWQTFRAAEVIEAPVTVVKPAKRAPAEPPEEPAAPATRREGLGAFSGALRQGVDPSVGALPTQGVLEVAGPSAVTVEVDGEAFGALPIALALDEGRHLVRYRFDNRTIDRVYFVKAGMTRALRVITRPGGFVDAR